MKGPCQTGPFEVRFDAAMNSLKLKQVGYHREAFIFPDFDKTLQPESIHCFSVVLETKAGKQVFGGIKMVSKVIDLLSNTVRDCTQKMYQCNSYERGEVIKRRKKSLKIS